MYGKFQNQLEAELKNLNDPQLSCLIYNPDLGVVKEGSDVVAPVTEKEGESKEFYDQYAEIIDAMADLNRN